MHYSTLLLAAALHSRKARRHTIPPDEDTQNVDGVVADFMSQAVDKDTYKEGVAKALNPTLDENYKHASTIVTNRLERFKVSVEGEPRHACWSLILMKCV